MWRLDEIVEAVRGTVYRVEKETFTGISTDSRSIKEGDLFVPITGPNFDGHLFCPKAYETSHGGSLCEAGREDVCRTLPGTVILVEDSVQALLDLAQYKRRRLNTTCIAITGSNGKTTTKEILVNMMKDVVPIHFNEKNYNNLIGVSQSILAVEGSPRFCIFELGTNAPGEIAKLATAVKPDLSLITNVNPSHLEGLKSVEGVLEEKLSLFYLTQEGGRIFVNADDPSVMPRVRDINRQALTFGIDNEADFRLAVDEDLGWEGARITVTSPDGSFSARTNLLGKHNLYNILAASAIACSTGIEKRHIARSIENFTSFNMRFRPLTTKMGVTVIDDTYNANPSSIQWAIRTLLELPARGRRIAVLGDMRELGEQSAEYHRELGRFLKETEISFVALIGREVEEIYQELGQERARLFEDKGSLIDYLAQQIKEGDTVLIKGSRASRMEEIVEALR